MIVQELERVRGEKQQIKLQYTREIEVAQVQLGAKESQLLSKHLQAVQHLQNEKQQSMS